jgi:hypothetical protein
MRIDHYSFGKLVAQGIAYGADLILTPDGVEASWWRKEGHRLCLEDLQAALAARPEVLVIGTGESGMMAVPAELRRQLADLGLEVHAATTAEAVRIYNELAPGRRTAAALHLTC